MALIGHDCDRFRSRGIDCPFRRFKEDDEEEPDEEQQIPFVMKKQQEQELDNLRQFPIIAHGDPAMRKALERMAAIKRDGGLPSIPPFRNPVPAFPLQGRGHPEIISAITAIAIMKALRSMRATGSNPGLQPVMTSERRVAKGLSRVLGRQSGGLARTGGRGGLHVNAAAELQNLLGFRRKLGPSGNALSAGVDSFSETGFN